MDAEKIKKLENLLKELMTLYRLEHMRYTFGWVDGEEARSMLNISKRCWFVYREEMGLPKSSIRGKYYYKIKDIDAYLEANYK